MLRKIYRMREMGTRQVFVRVKRFHCRWKIRPSNNFKIWSKCGRNGEKLLSQENRGN